MKHLILKNIDPALGYAQDNSFAILTHCPVLSVCKFKLRAELSPINTAFHIGRVLKS